MTETADNSAHAVLATVAIPTFRRPDLLAKAIESVRRQVGVDLSRIEILIVDNDAEASAADVARQMGGGAPALRYVHECGIGPSFARNRAVREARGEVLVFLDDDEFAAPNWLADLLLALQTTGADAVFGAVVPEFESAPSHILKFASRIYTRNLPVKSLGAANHLHANLGTGNSAFVRAACFVEDAPFSEELSAFGGEDVEFLRRLAKSGRRLVWVPRAVVTEHVPGARLTHYALWRRRFRQGQLRSSMCLHAGARDYLGLAFWMGVGLVQTFVHATGMLVCRISADREGFEAGALKCAGGLGKLFWWEAPEPHYGLRPPQP